MKERPFARPATEYTIKRSLRIRSYLFILYQIPDMLRYLQGDFLSREIEAHSQEHRDGEPRPERRARLIDKIPGREAYPMGRRRAHAPSNCFQRSPYVHHQ